VNGEAHPTTFIPREIETNFCILRFAARIFLLRPPSALWSVANSDARLEPVVSKEQVKHLHRWTIAARQRHPAKRLKDKRFDGGSAFSPNTDYKAFVA
jgi:hypothetical protein